MRIVLLILLLLSMAAVVYVLARGVIAMASGKDVTGEQSQMWMRRRVMFQAVAIILVILILAVAGAASHLCESMCCRSTRSTRAPATAAARAWSTAAASASRAC